MKKNNEAKYKASTVAKAVVSAALSAALVAYLVPSIGFSWAENTEEDVVAAETVDSADSTEAAPEEVSAADVAETEDAVSGEGDAEGEAADAAAADTQEAQEDAELNEDDTAAAAASAGEDASKAKAASSERSAKKAARTAKVAGIDGCDFEVEGDAANYRFDADAGVLYVSGDATVSNKEGVEETKQRIVVEGNATVTLSGVNIKAAGGPAIKVNSDAEATITLADGSENVAVSGGGNYAGVEVSWASGVEFASLTINGAGALDATGNGSGAGIGGSKAANGVYGNITIDGGTITATGVGRSAGIGSSDNPNDTTSLGSYKYTEEQWGTITINGGSIIATGVGNGAGIGGGNHTSSGVIIINGGEIDAKGDSGIGSGLGSSSGAGKGPGYYYADVTINGGKVTAYATNNMGAGIGGGMYSDARVTINGGEVTASVNPTGSVYQGGAGIGGGYQGCAVVKITGGTVNATGGNGSPGIGNGALGASTTSKSYKDGEWTGTKNVRTGKPTIGESESLVEITGGTVKAYGGYAGAGIGSGNCSEWCNVLISGGDVLAVGSPSSEGEMFGAAGIGSGAAYVPSKMAYMKQTDVDIAITGGNVVAIGGWGASGIGSGTQNKIANSITIDVTNANIEAYADGTKETLINCA